MSTRKKSDLIAGIVETAGKESLEDDAYIALSIRPGRKLESLLELISKLMDKSPAEYAGDEISESLFQYISSSDEALELAAAQIERILSSGRKVQKGSALDLLIERRVIIIDH